MPREHVGSHRDRCDPFTLLTTLWDEWVWHPYIIAYWQNVLLWVAILQWLTWNRRG